jgi:hypothetical protein
MKTTIAAYVAFLILATGCATNPDGSNGLTPEGQIALETSVRIAVRHAVADSPRAAEKAANIRTIVARLQAVTSAESTLGALKDEVIVELDRLHLDPIDRADAVDLLNLLAVALEAKLGPDAINSAGLVRVNDFLVLVLSALPAPVVT